MASLWNSTWVAALATAIVIPLAFGYAHALTRSCMPAKGRVDAAGAGAAVGAVAAAGLALVYLFGTQGMLKRLLFGGSIYGAIGIVIAQVFYCFPARADHSRDGAGARRCPALRSRRRRCGTPSCAHLPHRDLAGRRYGLISAAFVVFTLVITDFGIAKVIGGQFNVLATDAYKQVIGQQNFSMGAVVGMILLVPAILAFAIDRLVQRRQVALLSARAVPLEPKPNARATSPCSHLLPAVVAVLIVGVLGTAVWASFITYWPYNLSLDAEELRLRRLRSQRLGPYFNS